MQEQTQFSLWQRLKAKTARWQAWASPQVATSKFLTFSDRENLRRGRLMASVLLGSQPMNLLLTLTTLYPVFDLLAFVIMVVVILTQLYCIALNRRGKVAFVATLYLMNLICGTTIALFTPHFDAPLFGVFLYPFFCLPVVASAYMRNHRTPKFYWFLSCVIIGIHIAFHASKLQVWDQTKNISLVGIWAITTSTLSVLAILSGMGAKSMEDALLNADRAEELEAMNEELSAMQQELEAQYHQLEEANTRLEYLAATDGLTGLANHRAFQEELSLLIARTERDNKPLALILIDVDHFKKYNDSFGHPAGDEVLKTVAALLRDTVRKADFPARYGGEEFAALLYNADTEAAAQIAERYRAAIANCIFPNRAVTVSIGISVYHRNDDGAMLIQRADSALYHAKHNGRNRVVFYEQISQSSAA